MSDTIDRSKLSKAFSYLSSGEGEHALDKLNEGLEHFRGAIGEKLNDAEFGYLSTALLQQRSNDFSGRAGIPLQGTRNISPAVNLRHGFQIAAKI